MQAIDKKFYNLFWNNPVCQSIFSVHKEQLLENEVELIFSKEHCYAQRIILTNSKQRKTDLQVAQRTENENIEVMHNIQNAISKYFNQDKIEDAFKMKFGKSIKKLVSDLSENKVTLESLVLRTFLSLISDNKDFYKILSEYYIIPEGIETQEQYSEFVITELKTFIKNFLKKENLFDLSASIDLVSNYYNQKIKKNLISAVSIFTDNLLGNENFQSRILFFDQLFDMKVIIGGKSKGSYECINCDKDTFNGIFTINVKPSKLKLKCPSCSKEMNYMMPYELDKGIYDNILYQDGLLFFAIKYLLDDNKCKYTANARFLKDIEIDFHIEAEDGLTELVEVKMYKTDRPAETQISNIKTAVSQLKTAIDKLVKGNINIHQSSLVTNITDENIYKQAKKELEDDLKKYNIKIYAMNEYYMKIKG